MRLLHEKFLTFAQDMAKELLPDILPWILKGLQDGDDDVRAVAAAALLPVAEELGNSFQEEVSLSGIELSWKKKFVLLLNVYGPLGSKILSN